jgi:hypothetical protein
VIERADRPIFGAMIQRLTDRIVGLQGENARLRFQLAEEWELNHFEHCGRLPHNEGTACLYPYPAVLRDRVSAFVWPELLDLDEEALLALLEPAQEPTPSAPKR